MKRHFISIAGNIGAGKSTLVKLLSDELHWTPIYEEVVDNPYLSKFYKNMRRWGFHSQIFFLTQKIKQYSTLAQQRKTFIQDRSIYEDSEIFAKNLHIQRNIPDDDYAVYRQLYESVLPLLMKPDLLIYLKASVPELQKRIAQRGRSYEQSIPEEYLKQLNRLYNKWINTCVECPVLVIDIKGKDFLNDKADLALLISQMKESLQ